MHLLTSFLLGKAVSEFEKYIFLQTFNFNQAAIQLQSPGHAANLICVCRPHIQT